MGLDSTNRLPQMGYLPFDKAKEYLGTVLLDSQIRGIYRMQMNKQSALYR